MNIHVCLILFSFFFFRKKISNDIIFGPAGKQSEKPSEIYEIIEKLMPGASRVELFARNNNIRRGMFMFVMFVIHSCLFLFIHVCFIHLCCSLFSFAFVFLCCSFMFLFFLFQKKPIGWFSLGNQLGEYFDWDKDRIYCDDCNSVIAIGCLRFKSRTTVKTNKHEWTNKELQQKINNINETEINKHEWTKVNTNIINMNELKQTQT